MSLVEWMAAGGDAIHIFHNDQSVNLNKHYIAFNFISDVSEGVQENIEDYSKCFEDIFVEENEVDEIFSAEFMQDNKIDLDTFLYSSDLFVVDAFDVLPEKTE